MRTFNTAFLIVAIAALLLCICGATTVQNQPPAQPRNPNPPNGATNVPTTPILSWFCVDPDGDRLMYNIYFGTNLTPPLVASNISSNSYNPGTLQYNTKYYWKVVAKDDKGGITEGPIWSFTTAREVTVSLEWQKCLGGSKGEFGFSIQQTIDGGYIIAGSTNSDDGDVSGYRGYYDIWVVKLDVSG
ncbi:MAG: hypothetical protein H5T94_08875, partial [Pseudothermotoga sp.]|nr:hypothetical protein [Pseudothermotoga sp.]